MFKMFFGTAILATVLGLLVTQRARNVTHTDQQATARAILYDAIKAQGGDAVLARIVATYVELKGSGYDGEKKSPMAIATFYQGFDKMRTGSLNEATNFTEIEVINGKEGWLKKGDLPAGKLEGEKLELHREYAYPNWATQNLVTLKDKEFRMSPLDEISIAGRKAVGILVSHDKHNPLKLYFDKETHLLTESDRKVTDPDTGVEIDDKCLYLDYRDIQGTKQPFRFEQYCDGEKAFDLVVIDAKLYEKPLDEKIFAKP